MCRCHAFYGPVGLGVRYSDAPGFSLLALSYGGATSGATISMHYNRWAWAVTFVALALALLPARTACAIRCWTLA